MNYSRKQIKFQQEPKLSNQTHVWQTLSVVCLFFYFFLTEKNITFFLLQTLV